MNRNVSRNKTGPWTRLLAITLSCALLYGVMPSAGANATEQKTQATVEVAEGVIGLVEIAPPSEETGDTASTPQEAESKAPAEEAEPEAPAEESAQEPEAPAKEPAQEAEPEAPAEEPAQEPEAPTAELLASTVQELADSAEELTTDPQTEDETADTTTEQGVAGAKTAQYNGYTVTVEYGADANLPEGVELSVEAVADADRDTYQTAVEEKFETASKTQFFQIHFKKDGKEIKPAAESTVKVCVAFPEDSKLAEGTQVKAVRFVNGVATELENPNVTTNDISFEVKGADLFGVDTADSIEAKTSLPMMASAEDGIAVTAITGPKTVAVGSTITLECGNSRNCWSGRWSSNNTAVATVSGNGSSATVTGKAAGTVTIRHTHGYGGEPTTFEVTVTKPKAAIYYLKTPTSDADSNETEQWLPETDKSKLFATINVQEPGDNVDYWKPGGNDPNKNIMDNPEKYIVSWPDESEGSTWTLTRDDSNTDSTFTTVLDSIWNAYKSELEEDLGITDLEKNNITSITLVPHKISRANGKGNQFYHVDCTISVKCSQVYTAKFWVKEPGSVDYSKQVAAKNYKNSDPVENAEGKNYYNYTWQVGNTREVDGKTYVLKGWYPENDNGNARSDKMADFNYKPTAKELSDGTVNFYAEWVPATTDVTIQKFVTGNMGDKSKEFSFTVTSSNGAMGAENGYTLADKTATFSLSHQDKVTLENVPIGSTLTIIETNADDYTMTAKVGETTLANNQYTIPADANDPVTITVTNEKNVTVDSGIHMDAMPYILMLAMVLAGGGLFLKKRKDRTAE